MLPRAVSVLLLHGFTALNVGGLEKPVCIKTNLRDSCICWFKFLCTTYAWPLLQWKISQSPLCKKERGSHHSLSRVFIVSMICRKKTDAMRTIRYFWLVQLVCFVANLLDSCLVTSSSFYLFIKRHKKVSSLNTQAEVMCLSSRLWSTLLLGS